jgi:hypothetical protein
MAVSKEITQVRSMVTDLLKTNPKYRDSDKMLCSKIWSIQLGGMDSLKKISAYDFLTMYVQAKGKLFSGASIERVRRKIQEETPSLRGEKWKERNEEQADVVRVLGYGE